VYSISVLLSADVLTFEFTAVRPRLLSASLLQVSVPATGVHGSILVLESALTVGFVVEPATLVSLTRGMLEGTMAIALAKVPFASVLCAVVKFNCAAAVSETCQPLSIVYSTACLVGVFSDFKLRILAEQVSHADFLATEGFPVVGVLEVSAF